MTDPYWIQEFSEAVTVCDTQGTILEINESALAFNHRVGENLISANVIDCHPIQLQPKVMRLLKSGEKHFNIIEQNGNLYITYYAPWYKDGNYSGLVEFILEIPDHERHLIQKQQ